MFSGIQEKCVQGLVKERVSKKFGRRFHKDLVESSMRYVNFDDLAST